jgi:hypothetical protein
VVYWRIDWGGRVLACGLPVAMARYLIAAALVAAVTAQAKVGHGHARSGILQLKAKRATLALPPSPPPSRLLSGGEVACLFEADPLPRSPPAYVDALGNLRVTLTKPFTGEPSIGASATNGDRTRARRARSEFQLTLHFTRRLALRAKGARVRDSTVYGGSSTSAKSSFEHHTQQLAAAVQVDDAMGTGRRSLT